MWEAKLSADRVSFVLVDSADRDNEASLYFEGRVDGGAIEGDIHPARRGKQPGLDQMAGAEGQLMSPLLHGVMRATAAGLLCLVAVAGTRIASAQFSDVPYVPTSWNVVEAMLTLAKVGPDDYLIDLGSGDGRIVISAAKKHGARGLGVDIDGALVSGAQREAQRQGVGDKVAFVAGNLFDTDISKATVVTMYLFPQVNMRLRPRLLKELKPGSRIVSHEFDMGNWQPDAKLTVAVPDKPYGAPSSDVFLWVVPADASGKWRWRLAVAGAAGDYELGLEQTFQMLQGEPRVAGKRARFAEGRVRGENVSFTLTADVGGREVRHEFSGRISGDSIDGRVVLSGGTSAQSEWQATRTARGRLNINARVASRPEPKS
jgi:hypothetical protein